MDKETELMICMKEQGYAVTLDGKTISFSIGVMLDMWDILNLENSRNITAQNNNEKTKQEICEGN